MKRDEEVLLRSDEVLLSLAHRTAYRTITIFPHVAYVLGTVIALVSQTPTGITIGVTIMAVAYLTSLCYELALGYSGVSSGVKDLERRGAISSRTIYRRILTSALYTASVWLAVSLFAMNETVMSALVQAFCVGAITATIQYIRWRRLLIPSGESLP